MKKQFRKYFVGLLLIINTATGLSQDFTLQRYSVKDGLPGTQIHHLYQDSYGFLWIGSTSGLSRFDGKNFKNYGQGQGLDNLFVLAIYEDKQQRLWIGTTDKIFQLKGNHLIKYPVENDEKFGWLSHYVEVNNQLLAVTDSGTFYLEDSIWKRISFFAGQEKRVCRQIFTTTEGLYFNYGNEIIFQSKDGKYKSLAQSPDKNDKTYFNHFTKVNNRIFLSSENRLYEVTSKTLLLLIDNIPTKGYFSYSVDKNYNCWVGIENKGIFFYQLKEKEYKSVFHLPFTPWILPFVDRENTVWWGSYEGLLRLIPKLFENVLNVKTDTAISQINNVVSLNENELLLAVTDKGFFRYKNRKFIAIPKPSSYKNNQQYYRERIDGYAKDGEKNTWIFTRFRHLFLWNGVELLDKTHLLRLTSGEYFYTMAVNPITHQPFICGDSTLLVLEGEKFVRFTDKDGHSIQKAQNIIFISNGTGIVNNSEGYTYLITPDKKIIEGPAILHNSENKIITSHNTRFFAGGDNSFWVANAGKGLMYYQLNNKNEVTATQKITIADGLPDDIVQQVITDEQGRKWVITNSGLAILYQNNKKGNPDWDVFNVSKAQGFTAEEWSSANFAKDNSGTLWFASTDNLLKIKTSQLVIEKKTPQAVIEEVLLNMKETNWPQYSDAVYSYLQIPINLQLKHTQNSLGIRFKGIALESASHLEYSYQLEPVDTGWSNPSTDNFVSLVRLSPGSYTLYVRVRGKGTAWSKPAQFSFTITPPFWLTWWFRLSLLLLVSLAIFYFLYSRIKKIKKGAAIQNQIMDLEMKALKAQMNPHFIYNALNSIQALIADNKKNDAIMYVGSFSRLLRQVLEHSENNVIPLEREIETMKLYISLEALRLNMNLSYSIKTDETIILENEKIPPLILQPFIENALWHGLSEKKGERILQIKISQEVNWLICTVEDNGIGRPMADAKKGLTKHQSKGIDITRQRLINFNNNTDEPLAFIDLLDGTGNAAGTRVVVKISRPV